MDDEQRLLRIERHFDTLKYCLHRHNLLLLAFAIELSKISPSAPLRGELIQEIKSARESLESLSNLIPINLDKEG
ncbi:hypothetical protein NIES4101_46170 [Calothrix sp. NIES-4101]|nr:hypothetical protein NIES4101_46170 [Calothrix sp. NIES-4101]